MYNIYIYLYRYVCRCTSACIPRNTPTRMSFYSRITLSSMTQPHNRSSACVLRIIQPSTASTERRHREGAVPVLLLHGLHNVAIARRVSQKHAFYSLYAKRLMDKPIPSQFHRFSYPFFILIASYKLVLCVLSYPLKCHKSSFNVGLVGRINRGSRRCANFA